MQGSFQAQQYDDDFHHIGNHRVINLEIPSDRCEAKVHDTGRKRPVLPADVDGN